MASSPIASDKLEQQLTCAVCLDIYTDPRILPCHHSFCLHCLESLPVTPEGNKYYITCPSCCTPTELPEPKGPAGIPVAFQLNSFLEVHSLMKKGYDIYQEKTSVDYQLNCSKHNDPLKVFCETCEEVICHDCTFRDHKNHDCAPITDIYDKHRQKIITSLTPVKEMLSEVENVLNVLNNRENEIKEQKEVVKQQIHVAVEEMIDALRQSERQLTGEVETVTDSKLLVLSSQKKLAEISLSQLKGCKEFVEETIKIGSPQQVLMSKKQMIERMSHVIKEINVEEYNPLEKADVQFINNGKLELHHIGDIGYTATLQQCKVKKIEVTFDNKKVSFQLSMELPDSSLLIVPLSSLSCSVVSADNIPINTTVTTTDQPGVYRIHCSPVVNGPHQVNAKVGNVHLESTSVVIPFGPYLDSFTSMHTIDGLNSPYGVAVSTSNCGCAIVTEPGSNCITILDGIKKVKSIASSKFGKMKFSTPRGVAITPENFILVSDEHKIRKLTMDGKLVASVGSSQCGREPLEFTCPSDITISLTTGQIFVADRGNHRIQVLNPDLAFAFKFGRYGSAEGQFNCPHFITIDNQGLVYVSDLGNHRIQKFTSDGKFISQFGTRGSGPGQLQSPTGIAIKNNLLFVAEERNNRVSIFTIDGQFVRCFGTKDQFRWPNGITFDNEGFLYICDHLNNTLLIY